MMRHVKAGNVTFGNDLPLVFISGPCQIESRAHALETAAALKEIAASAGVPLIYKSSFDKANRTSVSAARGIGMKEGLAILAEVREATGLPVLTDVHNAANPGLSVPPDGFAIGRWRYGPRHQCEEGAVPRTLGYEECRGENREHGQS